MSQIIKVYNSTDNKYEELDSDIATETTLSSVNTTLTTGNISTRDQIRDQRANGNCYFWSTSGSDTSLEGNKMGVFWNPANSGYTYYIYNVSIVATSGATSSVPIDVILCEVTGITEEVNSIIHAGSNMKLGTTSDTDIKIYIYMGDGGSTTNGNNIINRILKPNTSDTNDTNLIDFQEDLIEVPEGSGVRFMFKGNNNGINVTYATSLRYIKTTTQL